MLFEPMTLKDAEEFYFKINNSCLSYDAKEEIFEDLIYYTENFERDYGSPFKKVKYYVEFRHCDDGSLFAVQSKWFDELEQAREWFENDIDFLGEDYDAYVMYAEWDETSDSYGDIEQFEQLFKRS